MNFTIIVQTGSDDYREWVVKINGERPFALWETDDVEECYGYNVKDYSNITDFLDHLQTYGSVTEFMNQCEALSRKLPVLSEEDLVEEGGEVNEEEAE